MATVLKIVYGKDIRRCTLSEGSATWSALQRRVIDLLGVDLSGLRVTYKDDEGDVVTITTDGELEEALRLAAQSTPAILRLTVLKKPTPPSTPPRDVEDEAQATASAAQGGNFQEIIAALATEIPGIAPILNRIKSAGRAAAGAPPPPPPHHRPSFPFHHGPPSRGGPYMGHGHPFGGPPPFGRGHWGPGPHHPFGPHAAEGFGAPPGAGVDVPAVGPGDACASNPQGMHPFHTCDKCDASPILGVRYHSKSKANFDLCPKCYDAERNAFPEGERAAFDADWNPIRPPPLGPHGHFRRGCRGGGGSGAGPCAGGGKVGGGKVGARFIRDVTVFDGTEVSPSSKFTKIWRMRNEGAVPWPQGTRIVFCGGDRLAAAESVPVGRVEPGAEVDVAVDMAAPDRLGRYVGYWRLAGPAGRRFGQRVWVNVTVADPAAPPTFNADMDMAGDQRSPQDKDHGGELDQEEAEGSGAPASDDAFEAHGLVRVLSDIARHAAAAMEEGVATVEAAAAAEARAAEAPTAMDTTETAAPRVPEQPAEAVTPAPAVTPTPTVAAPASGEAGPSGSAAAPPLSFPVEVADGRRLTLSWAAGADAEEVASAFAREHRLGAADRSDVVAFIKHAEDLVNSQARRAAGKVAAKGDVAPAPAAEAGPAPLAVAAPTSMEVEAQEQSAAPAPAAPQAPSGGNDDAGSVAAAEDAAVEALEAMGFGGGRALLSQVVRNNKADLAACVSDLSQLQDWDTLLQDLEAMGFEDEAKNREALLKHGGSVKGAVRELVKGSDE